MTETMSGAWTPPEAHERGPAPNPPEQPGPGLDRSDIPAPLPGRPLWVIFGTLLMIAGLSWGTFNVIDLLAHGERTDGATLAAVGIETIQVDNASGFVEIVGTDTDEIRIDAQISTGLRRTGYGWVVEGSTLRVHGTCPIIGSQWCWVKYTITVPSNVDVVVNNDDSRVTVSNIDGNVEVDADNGRVVLAGVSGTVVVNSDNGRVEGSGLSGSTADVSSDNGRVELSFTEVPDRVEARSDNGSIDIGLPDVEEGYNIDSSTDNGSEDVVGIADNATSPHTVIATSDNGSVTIRAAG